MSEYVITFAGMDNITGPDPREDYCAECGVEPTRSGHDLCECCKREHRFAENERDDR